MCVEVLSFSNNAPLFKKVLLLTGIQSFWPKQNRSLRQHYDPVMVDVSWSHRLSLDQLSRDKRFI